MLVILQYGLCVRFRGETELTEFRMFVTGRSAEAKRRRGQSRPTKRVSQPVRARIEKTPGTRARAAGDWDRERWLFVGTRRRLCQRRRRITGTLRADIQGYR